MAQDPTITGGTFYHVAGAGYVIGDDLVSWDEHMQRYGDLPGAWKWEYIGDEPDLVDTDLVSLFETLDEAREMQETYGGTILEVTIPEAAHDLGLRGIVNDEGYPCIFTAIPAAYITVAE